MDVATRAAINVGDSSVFAGAAGVVVAVAVDFTCSGPKRHSRAAADGDSVGRSAATTATGIVRPRKALHQRLLRSTADAA